jgi:hypothetical protein
LKNYWKSIEADKMGKWKASWRWQGFNRRVKGESRFRLECGGGRVGMEACGDRLTPDGGIAAWSHYLERVGMVEDLAKRFPAERTRPNATPFRQSGRQRTFKPAVSEKRWAAIRQACKRLQRPFQVRRFA